MKPYKLLFLPLIALAGCICEPAPEGRQIQNIAGKNYISRYDSNVTVSILLEPKYRSIKNKDKKFGCLGYYEVLSYNYLDTLQVSTLEMTCSENIGGVNGGENWLNHANTITQYGTGPGNSVTQNINLYQIIGATKYKQLPDSALFRLKYRDSKNAAYEDSFFVQFVK